MVKWLEEADRPRSLSGVVRGVFLWEVVPKVREEDWIGLHDKVGKIFQREETACAKTGSDRVWLVGGLEGQGSRRTQAGLYTLVWRGGSSLGLAQD